MEPRIIPRPQHCISRKNIDPDALKVLYRLHRAGFTAYLVGGGVRDLLLGRRPKDFDVGTAATPSQVRKLFRNCWLIGRRFRLAHIHFRGGKVIEVSTFRGEPERGEDENPEELLVRRDNTFGTPEEAALRRDFTINGLFYDIGTFSLIDYLGGVEDVESRIVRTIGDPDIRFREDPVRMIRAIKFAARLDFDIERQTWDALVRHRLEILKSPPSRVEEIGRLLEGGAARRSFELLAESGFLEILQPTVSAYLHPDRSHWEDALHSVEGRVQARRDATREGEAASEEGEERPTVCPLPPPEAGPIPPVRHDDLLWDMLGAADELHPRSRQALFSSLVYPLLEAARGELGEGQEHEVERLSQDLLFSETFGSLITRRDRERIAEILMGQRRLTRRRRKGPAWAIMRKPYFLDALQFLEIHALATGEEQDSAARWRERYDREQGEVEPYPLEDRPAEEHFHDDDLEDFEARELVDSREFRWEDLERAPCAHAIVADEPQDERGRRVWADEPRPRRERPPRVTVDHQLPNIQSVDHQLPNTSARSGHRGTQAEAGPGAVAREPEPPPPEPVADDKTVSPSQVRRGRIRSRPRPSMRRRI